MNSCSAMKDNESGSYLEFCCQPSRTGRGKNLRAAAAKLDGIVQDKKILLSDHACPQKTRGRGTITGGWDYVGNRTTHPGGTETGGFHRKNKDTAAELGGSLVTP